MSQATATAEHVPTAAREQAKTVALGPWAWARTNLFGSTGSTIVTLALGYIILRILFGLFEWGVVNAIWTVPYGPTGIADTSVCQNAKGVGACWAVLTDKYPADPVRPLPRTTSNGARRSSCCCSSACTPCPPCGASGARSWC